MFFFDTKRHKQTDPDLRQAHHTLLMQAAERQEPYFVMAECIQAYARIETDLPVFTATLDNVMRAVEHHDSAQKAADILALCLKQGHAPSFEIVFAEKLFSLCKKLDPYEAGNADGFTQIGQRALLNKALADYLATQWPVFAENMGDGEQTRHFTWHLCRGVVHPQGIYNEARPSDLGDLLIGNLLEGIQENTAARTDTLPYFGYAGLQWTQSDSETEQMARQRLLVEIDRAQTPNGVASIVLATCHMRDQRRPDDQIDIIGTEKWEKLVAALPDHARKEAATTVIGDRLNNIIGESRMLSSAVHAVNEMLGEYLSEQSLPAILHQAAKTIVDYELGAFRDTQKLLRYADALDLTGAPKAPQTLIDAFRSQKKPDRSAALPMQPVKNRTP